MALAEAQAAAAEGEIPVGAVAVLGNDIIARDHNRSIQTADPTAHAEILVLRSAGSILSNYRLEGVMVYATLEPCSMCAGALIWARIRRLTFGARDPQWGAVLSKSSLLSPGRFNHNVEVTEGVLADPCREILQGFFRARRKKP